MWYGDAGVKYVKFPMLRWGGLRWRGLKQIQAPKAWDQELTMMEFHGFSLYRGWSKRNHENLINDG